MTTLFGSRQRKHEMEKVEHEVEHVACLEHAACSKHAYIENSEIKIGSCIGFKICRELWSYIHNSPGETS